jgi:PAS domain S-box-containing protein
LKGESRSLEEFRLSGEVPVRLGSDGRGRHPESDSRLTVLIVDEDEPLCDSLASLLRVVGCDVTGVYTGAEGIAVAQERKFDVAVLDIVLPDMDGIEVLEALRRVDPDLGTVVLYGQASLADAVEALNRGADAFIQKPADPDMLLSRINSVARVRRLYRSLRRSEARYREFFEDMEDGAFQSDLDGNYVAINRAGAETLGFEEPQRLLDGGLKVWETYDLRETYEMLLSDVLDYGSVREVLRRFRRRDGTLGWLETTMRARYTGDVVVGFEGVFRDVTDRIRYQEMLEALHDLWADFAEVDGVEDIAGLTLDFLRAMLDVDYGFLGFIEGDSLIRIGLGVRGDESQVTSLKDRSIVRRALRTGESQLISYTCQDGDGAYAGDIVSVLAVPVIMGGEVVASITVGASRNAAFVEGDVKIVEIIAEHIASALGRMVSTRFGLRPSLKLRDYK